MADVYRDILLKTLKETPSKTKPGAGYGMWVIQRVKNDASFKVTVRSGGFYTDAVTGDKRYPKDGLDLFDFNTLSPIFKTEIKPLLEIPKGTVVAAADAPPLAEPEPEQMPW